MRIAADGTTHPIPSPTSTPFDSAVVPPRHLDPSPTLQELGIHSLGEPHPQHLDHHTPTPPSDANEPIADSDMEDHAPPPHPNTTAHLQIDVQMEGPNGHACTTPSPPRGLSTPPAVPTTMHPPPPVIDLSGDSALNQLLGVPEPLRVEYHRTGTLDAVSGPQYWYAEETDLPDTYSLIDLIELAHTDGLLDLVDNLSWGKWPQFWPWVKRNAIAWGYSSLGHREPPSPTFASPDPQPRPPLAITAFRILTQNVDGFRVDSVRAWMASWKDGLTHERLDIICLQETHVGSPAQRYRAHSLLHPPNPDTPPQLPMIIAGDFNCVSSPHLDRTPTCPPRSPTLTAPPWKIDSPFGLFTTALDKPARPPPLLKPSPSSAPAHTRVYGHNPSPAPASIAYMPTQRSQRRLRLRCSPTHRSRNARHQLYPIRSAQPLRLQQHILHFLHAASADPVPPADICARWDDFIDSLQGLLRQLQLAETPPRQTPLPIDTPSQRLETIEAYANQLAEINRYRHGRSMIEGMTPSAAFFRRFTNRWDKSELPSISPPDCAHLLAPCTPYDLSMALKKLHGGKAPGPDGIPTKFYHHFSAALSPLLLRLGRAPLKKKGNSTNALGYRPISLLNSTYKIFAQILAIRLPPLLAVVIGSQQQGLFQRALAFQSSDPLTPLEVSAII
ncbi:hypothetical protein H257_14839 [Aphanomyces astaci]|uniref:Endonuclease/exonuclease/phosphatase domain-containing protein n=1 Tax=Aphanomyces astaci TaxID=112090 RepID=W4FRK6_APHAT|nr:hypothetical protein H257_14839 [Aphanomyces astaci]ETV69469.1 hypothetical protein H257_14839 [Aphanomyces astaci]|eukprot:XP_009841042.1 hypothetical protein H257_14839 [Aphanomyces astaci]